MSQEEIQKLVDSGQLSEALALAKIDAITALQTVALICSRSSEHQDETIDFANMSIDVDPDNAQLYGNLSYFLGNQMRIPEALDAIDKAIDISPDVSEFYYNRAILLSGLKRTHEAIACYRSILEKDPNAYFAKFNIGCMLSMLGQYREGFACLEARFANESVLTKFRNRFPGPNWTGEDLKNKKLLLFSEQGCGDVIQFIRYLPLLPSKPFLIAEIQEELVPLLSKYFDITIGRSHDYNTEQPPDFPDHDYVVSFSSLPHLLDPDLTNTPPTPYLTVKKRSNMVFDKNKLNVGIIWAGGHFHPNDLNRSFPANTFLPLTEITGMQLYSLQKGLMERDYLGQKVDLKEGFEDLGAIDLADQLDDFYKTAQVIKKLDLVIAVDTAVAHLAGALGKPVWVMLPYCHDHRWLLDSKTTPWYATMRLFHQRTPRDWRSVVDEVVEELTRIA